METKAEYQAGTITVENDVPKPCEIVPAGTTARLAAADAVCEWVNRQSS